MVSAINTEHFARNLLMQMWDHDPGSTDAKVTSPDGGTTERWVDLRDYDHFACGVMATFRAGDGVALVEIVASDSPDETDASVTVVKTSGAVVADALGDWIFLECSAAEVAALATSYDLRYVAARITMAHEGDEAAVVYLADARRPSAAITNPTTIS